MVLGSELFSLLDGFSGYNKVLVAEEDRLKTTFRTRWGTFAYRRMPFGLINTGASFQRAMDIAFRSLIGCSAVVYLDDITIFSKRREEHAKLLVIVFPRGCSTFHFTGKFISDILSCGRCFQLR